jgi:hypothetical protein
MNGEELSTFAITLVTVGEGDEKDICLTKFIVPIFSRRVGD